VIKSIFKPFTAESVEKRLYHMASKAVPRTRFAGIARGRRQTGSGREHSKSRFRIAGALSLKKGYGLSTF
jgi:hypothetical protein